jgi:hypothetical protein
MEEERMSMMEEDGNGGVGDCNCNMMENVS